MILGGVVLSLLPLESPSYPGPEVDTGMVHASASFYPFVLYIMSNFRLGAILCLILVGNAELQLS